MMLNNSLIPARTEEIAERVFQPDVLAGHEYLDTYRRKSHLEPEKGSYLRGPRGRRAVLSGIRLCQVADVEATVSRCREMALEKRLAVDLLLQKHLRGFSIGPVLFKERTTALERSAHGN